MDAGAVARAGILLESIPLERLEAEITELAGHLAAAECRWLLLVAEFDRRAGYEEWACRSCARWLNWHCGLDIRAAREKVRVGRALEELPQITEAFAAGKLSYSKVRALTRVATHANEGDLVMLAEHATAVQVERIVRAYRGVLSVEEERSVANEQHLDQYMRFDWADDGSMIVNGRMAPEFAPIVLEAFRAARDQGREKSSDEVTAPAMTSAEAFAMIAESFLATGPAARTGGDRYQIQVNVDSDVLTDDADGVCEIDGGPRLAPETVRRLGCDASVVLMLRDEAGRPVNVSSRSRTIPSSLRRAVHARDGGCRFQACGGRPFTNLHHIRHYTRGGETKRDNLVELCWFHHRLVHEGGWDVRFDPDGELLAIQPNGNVLPRSWRPPAVAVDRGVEHLNHEWGIEIDRTTCIPHWYGDPLDLGHITTSLWCADHREELRSSRGCRVS